MRFQLFRRSAKADSIASLYGMIVAQAREPVFYQDYGVADTVNGRFEMVMLHTILVMRRLLAEPEPTHRATGQGIFDRFCNDMDGNLREMGVGDLAVPPKMQRIGEAFYGRQKAYETALAAGEQAPLAAALARNVFGTDRAPGAIWLAKYVLQSVRHLAGQDGGVVARADFAFPDPRDFTEGSPQA